MTMEPRTVQLSPAEGAGSLTLQVYAEISALEVLADKWNALVETSTYPNVFRRWEWISSWWKWFGANRRLHVVVIRRGPDVVGIVPWYTSRQRGRLALGGLKLAFIGSGGPTCPEYLGPIMRPECHATVIRELLAYVRLPSCPWDSIEFPDIAPDDAGTNGLIHLLKAAYPTAGSPGEVCPYVDLPESYELLMERLSSHTRRRKKWQLRRAVRECGAKLEVLQDPGPLREFFPAMVELSASSRGRSGERSPFHNEDYAGFHREVIEHLSRCRVARIYVLHLHGRPAAFIYGFIQGGKYSSFQTGFDPGAGKYSPGDVLHQMAFGHLIDEGANEFDFLRGEESYKDWYASARRSTETTWVYRRRGLAYIHRLLRLRVARPLYRWTKQQVGRVWARRRPLAPPPAEQVQPD